MRTCRFQFTLRTVFIVSFLCAIVCAVIKCRSDSEKNFFFACQTVQASMKSINEELDKKLYDRWLDEAKDNPTFPEFLRKFPAEADRIRIVVKHFEGFSDYYGMTDWQSVCRRVLSPTTDLPQKITDKEFRGPDAVDVGCLIRGPRYCGILSQTPSISISCLKTPDSDLVLPRLKADIENAGLDCDVREYSAEERYRGS
jgi:hypothetical protein